MKLLFIKEPRLQFAEGEHVCPRRGISTYGVYDKHSQTRRTRIHLGVVGTPHDLEVMAHWLHRMETPIAGSADERKTNRSLGFCGFNEDMDAKLIFNQDLQRPLRKTDIEEICRINGSAKSNFLDAANLTADSSTDPEQFHRNIPPIPRSGIIDPVRYFRLAA